MGLYSYLSESNLRFDTVQGIACVQSFGLLLRLLPGHMKTPVQGLPITRFSRFDSCLETTTTSILNIPFVILIVTSAVLFAFAKNRCLHPCPPPPACLEPADDQFTVQVWRCSEKLFNFFKNFWSLNGQGQRHQFQIHPRHVWCGWSEFKFEG